MNREPESVMKWPLNTNFAKNAVLTSLDVHVHAGVQCTCFKHRLRQLIFVPATK